MTMVTSEPPALQVAGFDVDASAKSDRAAAKRKLKKLPVPPASQKLPTVLRADAASVLKGLGDPKSKPVSSAGQPGPSSACTVQ